MTDPRDASPAFQPASDTADGFQVAAAHGFQTQGPHAAVDLELVVEFAPVTSGPPAAPTWVSGVVWLPRARHELVVLDVVVTLDVATRFSTALQRDDEDVLSIVAAGGLGRVALVVDDEDLVVLVAAGARGATSVSPMPRSAAHDAAAWLEEVEEDER